MTQAMIKVRLILVLFLIAILIFSCRKEEPLDSIKTEHKTTPYLFNLPHYFPNQFNIPDDNPMTLEGVALGRYLFYDGRLSGRTHTDSLMSCATCHLQEHGFSTGINHPKFTGGRPFGLTGIETPHFPLPLVNLVFNSNGYGWNGSVHESNDFLSEDNPLYHKRNIESITWMAITAPFEIYGTVTQTVELIANIPFYAPKFEAAFGTTEVTYERISKAIAQFVRTLVSSNSKFDKYLRGETQLTQEELQGFVLFTTESGADCFHCHGGAQNPLFTTNLFYNNAKNSVFSNPYDRYSITGNMSDIGAFKVPTLRNIELTAPYMHDGRFSTLEEVVDFYSEGLVFSPYAHPLMHKLPDGGAQLTPHQKNALLAFLKTLTDEEFITNPEFGKPDDL